VLFIDDDATFCRAMAKALGRKGFAVQELHGGLPAITALADESCTGAVAVLDLQMPDVSGMQVLRRTPRRHCPVVVLTGHGTIPDAVEAMRLGAFSFLLKPIDADELVPVLLQAMGAERATREQLIGDSAVMRQLRQVLESCAQAADPVLLYGETGTGKEVAATYLHERSRRNTHPLLAINLACLPRELVDSELFGHARGAFTGADRKKHGLFTEVGQGTLFLDEISELPLDLQPKLLRVLETRSFRPVGETREQPLQARLVCATNRDLRALVRQGLFREDLYYRLAVLPIELPPLRTHPDDIVPIAEHWLSKISRQGPTPTALRFSDDARRALVEHDYPGNVRELVNVVRRVVLFAQHGVSSSPSPGPPPASSPAPSIGPEGAPGVETGTAERIIDGPLLRRMLAEDPFRTLRPDTRNTSILVRVPSDLIGSAAIQTGPLSLRELEIQHIEKLLREHKNITTVAKLLEIDRRTLQRKLRSLDIDWQDE
jgi:DNA-binding NtrC family response regulator